MGVIVGAPIWLYQLWAFIAPGLHRHERKWAYVFVSIAAPLFATGAVLAYEVVGHSLSFIMSAGVLGEPTKLEIAKFAFDYTLDREKYFLVNDAFTFANTKEDLSHYIQSHSASPPSSSRR